MVKFSLANAGGTRHLGLIPGSGRSPEVGNGNLLQCSCLGNPMDRGAWWATVRGVAHTSYWLPSACLPPPTFFFPFFMLINPFRTDHVLETILSTFYIISHSPSFNPLGQKLLTSPFCRWENCGSELLEVIQMVSSRGKI